MQSKLRDTLLLVGDANSGRTELRSVFENTYNILEAEDTEQAVMLLGQNSSCIAAVYADIPIADGAGLRSIVLACHTQSCDDVPVIVFISPTDNNDLEEYAFLLGASDVITKPYTTLAVQRRTQKLMDLYQRKWELEKLVEAQNDTIRSTNQSMVDTLSTMIEYRSTDSGNHVLRIRRFTRILLEEVSQCCPEYKLTPAIISTISSAAALHDIGKIDIPDAILNKPGPLTDSEFDVIKGHTTVGSEIITHLCGMNDTQFLRYAYNIALYHHERWDGKGYPCGLKGDDIPICAQVVGLADAFDALTTKRVYKPALPYAKSINMILNGECGVFSPKLIECFNHVHKDFTDLARKYADGYSPRSDTSTYECGIAKC
jgi:putative two-component system response regulator